MDIQYRETAMGGRYYIDHGEGKSSELTWYDNRDGTITAEHTYVPVSQRGKGIAEKLVARFMDDVREKGWRVVPACSYVEAQFRRNPEWAAFRAEA